MAASKPEPGLVICYAYLWHQEFLAGQEEGAKDRPCAIILTTQDAQGETVVTVAPITHSRPIDMATAIEIPWATKKRLGLDDARSWVVFSETNRFVWPGPDLRPIRRDQPSKFDYGFLPPKLFRQVRDSLIELHRSKKYKSAKRTD